MQTNGTGARVSSAQGDRIVHGEFGSLVDEQVDVVLAELLNCTRPGEVTSVEALRAREVARQVVHERLGEEWESVAQADAWLSLVRQPSSDGDVCVDRARELLFRGVEE